MCLKLGIDDPREWLDTTPDSVVTLWQAFWKLEPWGNEYERHAEQMELLEAIFALQANSMVPKNRHDLKYKPRTRRSFMPYEYAGDSIKTPKKPSLDQQLQAFKEAMVK